MRDTVLVSGWTQRRKVYVMSVLREGKSQRDRCQTQSNSHRKEYRWQIPPQTALYDGQKEMVSTFWKGDWLKLVTRVKLIKYQKPLKRVFRAKFLSLEHPAEQNSARVEVMLPPNSSQRSKEVERNLTSETGKKNKRSRLLCPANFMSCKWQLKWLWNRLSRRLGTESIP